MEEELSHLDDMISKEIKKIKEKYSKIKIDIITKYRSNAGKYKRKSIPKAVKDKVWDTYIGGSYGKGKCYCCETYVDSKKFDCGHVVAAAVGGQNVVENLRPVCSTCNKSMGTQNMEEFKDMYFKKKKRWCGFC